MADTTDDNTLYVVDGTGFIFRAYHALPSLSAPDGTPTGAVYGFSSMLSKLLDDHDPAHFAVVFDAGERTFRNDIYPDYKANRPPPPEDLVPQFAIVERVVRAFNIPLLSLRGYEADDVIATLVRRAGEAGMSVVIVSSDKDLMQLASDSVALVDTMKDRRYGPAEVEHKFGVAPQQLGDWLALCGDTVDNVPGVPGIGPKTATKLLTQFGDLETVLASADQVRGAKLKQNLVQHAEQARLSRRLVQLDSDCPLEQPVDRLRRQRPDHQALWQLFGELGFGGLRQRLGAGEVLERERYRTIVEIEELRTCIDAARAAGEVAVDLETTSLDAASAQIVGVSLCWGEGQACYIPVGHVYLGAPPQLGLATVLEQLEPLLIDPSVGKYGQNYKYDWIVLRRAGVDMQGVTCDPMLASYVLDPSRSSHGLDALALDHLGHTMISYSEVTGGRGRTFDSVELGPATAYAAEDAEATFRLARLLGAQVAARPELAELLEQVELPLSRVLARMELRGVGLDVERLGAMSAEIVEQLTCIEAEVRAEAGWEVNLNSPKQLQKLLFDDLGLSTGRKTKTGFSTDADVLADLAIEHDIAATIEEFRTLSKLKNTYLDALPRLVNPDTGRVHTSYNQAVAATGRLSSSDPNLQNIPVRTDVGRRIREAFVPPAGRVMLSADYSQVELRLLAHLSRDPVLLEAFGSGQDVHQRTAAEVFGVPADEVTAEQRRVAKAVNFGVIYGQTDWGLARQLRIPRQQARQYIESYFARYAGVRSFMEQTIEGAREQREVRTILGRRRPLPDITSRRRNARLYAERIARNTPIQGSAADLMKIAMIRVQQALDSGGLEADMILTVHDELVFEVAPGDADALGELVREQMVGVFELDVPLVVDVGVGQSWADAH